MKAWLSKLVADLNGVPDEMRVVFIITEVVYLLLWLLWFGIGNWNKWPSVVIGFCGGVSAIAAAFGAAIRARGQH